MNTVILIGNISTDIDLKFTPNGNAVCKFNLAVNDQFNREQVDFVPVEAWKKSAENTAQYCGKGSKVAVKGRIRIEQYEKDGQKRTFTKVVAESIQFLDSAKGGTPTKTSDSSDPFGDYKESQIDDDQLPFPL